jgi:Flp pilus assembly pilin Flp
MPALAQTGPRQVRPGLLRRLQLRRTHRGQSVVEYMLVVSVIAIALAVGFIAFGESVRDIFHNVRRTVAMPYP